MPRTDAVKPVAHVTGRHVGDALGRERIVRQKQEMFLALFVDIGIVFVVALFLDELVTRASFTAEVEERGLFAHIAGKAGRVIPEAGGVADEKALWIFEQRLERVGGFAPVFPGEDSSMRDDRGWKVVAGEPVDQVDAVTHPLIGDSAGKILVKAEFEIETRIEVTEGLGNQPALPIGVGLAELRNLP